jgi:hypothetical protein
MAKDRVHFSVSRKIPHQIMLVCVNASGEALCPYIVTINSVILEIFQGCSQDGIDVKIRVSSSSYVNADIFSDYMRDVSIPHVENC